MFPPEAPSGGWAAPAAARYAPATAIWERSRSSPVLRTSVRRSRSRRLPRGTPAAGPPRPSGCPSLRARRKSAWRRARRLERPYAGSARDRSASAKWRSPARAPTCASALHAARPRPPRRPFSCSGLHRLGEHALQVGAFSRKLEQQRAAAARAVQRRVQRCGIRTLELPQAGHFPARKSERLESALINWRSETHSPAAFRSTKLLQGTFADQPPARKDADPIANSLCLGEQVRVEEERGPSPPLGEQDLS